MFYDLFMTVLKLMRELHQYKKYSQKIKIWSFRFRNDEVCFFREKSPYIHIFSVISIILKHFKWKWMGKLLNQLKIATQTNIRPKSIHSQEKPFVI